jgi:hypothetical protein
MPCNARGQQPTADSALCCLGRRPATDPGRTSGGVAANKSSRRSDRFVVASPRRLIVAGRSCWFGSALVILAAISLSSCGGSQEQPTAQGSKAPQGGEQDSSLSKAPKDVPGWESTRWGMTEKQVRAALTDPVDVPHSAQEQPSANKWYMPFSIRDFVMEGNHFDVRFFFDKRSKKLDCVYIPLHDAGRTSSADQRRTFERLAAIATERYGKRTSVKDRSSDGVHNEEMIWTFPSSVLTLQYLAVANSPAIYAFQFQTEEAFQYSENSMDPAPNAGNARQQTSTPPPSFRVYRSKMDEGTSVVVPPNTTEAQLKSLIWLFREKVRSHRYKEIGITQPTSKQRGKQGYLSGTISVYRGEKCAGEDFLDYNGPCVGPGIDSHEVAAYQWGLLVDGVFNTDADSGTIYVENEFHDRKLLEIFNYKDHWQVPNSRPDQHF